MVLGQRDKLADEERQVKERTESETEGHMWRQDKRVNMSKQPKSDKRQNGKRNLEVCYNPMGLDQGTGNLDMKYTQVSWLDNA